MGFIAKNWKQIKYSTNQKKYYSKLYCICSMEEYTHIKNESM